MLKQMGEGPVVVRLYTWSPPGFSLGYFQHHKEMEKHPGIHKVGAVMTRRLTGGDAILHYNELTFSLVGQEGLSPFHGTIESSYHRIHLALAAGFESIGIHAGLREGAKTITHARDRHDGRCFYAVTRYDLVAGDQKLVGSAQRRTSGRVLHHGSIPLGPNPMTPVASDLTTLSGKSVSYDLAVGLVENGFEKTFNVGLEPWQPGADLIKAAERLALEKYGGSSWIHRR
ncbi:MAG: hypothetical protein KJ645_09030 [Planctomycetes bacterium]|nr:hypothetical protein [Planctomycetota bacterium]